MTGRTASDNDTEHFNGMTFSNYKRKRILCVFFHSQAVDASAVVLIYARQVFFSTFHHRCGRRRRSFLFLFFRPKTRVPRKDAIFTFTVRFVIGCISLYTICTYIFIRKTHWTRILLVHKQYRTPVGRAAVCWYIYIWYRYRLIPVYYIQQYRLYIPILAAEFSSSWRRWKRDRWTMIGSKVEKKKF